MTQIDGLSFTQLTNLNIEGELYEHGVPFGGGVTAPLILSTANNPSQTPLILRGGGIEDDYDDINSALIFKDAADNEVWRIWGGDPDDSNDNAQNLFIGLNAGELINPWEGRGIAVRGREPSLTVIHTGPRSRVSRMRRHGAIGQRANPFVIRTPGPGGDGSNIKLDRMGSRQRSRIRVHSVSSASPRIF